MEQENDNVGSQNVAEVSSRLPLSEENKDAGNPGAPSSGGEAKKRNALSNVGDSGNSAGESSKGQQSQKRAPRKLMARPKALKKSSAKKPLKGKNAKATPEAKERFRKGNKNCLQSGDKGSNKRDDVDLREAPAEENREKNHKEEIHTEQDKQIQKSRDRIHDTSKRNQNRKNEGKRERSEGTSKDHRDKKKSDMKERRQEDGRKKEKLGGLIFMCNAKTRPDCFHYRVMGVSMAKKDLVLKVKRGLKLFLYDFDLRLMYGIYEASSPGGMRLEPKAFGGAFPVQVRFSVYKDCFPLSEGVFKKAIEDNYYEKHKFQTELTDRQVRKLIHLFRPVVSQSMQPVALPIHSSAIAPVRDREIYGRVRDSGRQLDREVLAISGVDGRGHPILSHEMDRTPYQEVVHSQRKEMPRNLYMSEREYRTFGLLGERRNLTASQTIASALDPYITDREGQIPFRQQDAEYKDSVAARREAVVTDSLYVAPRDVWTNDLGVLRGMPHAAACLLTATTSGAAVTATESYMRDQDPYHAYGYGASSLDTYLPPPRREEIPATSFLADNKRDSHLLDIDLLRRMESDHLAQLYRKYAVDVPPNHNQIPRHPEVQREPVPLSVQHEPIPSILRRETVPASVSSRYSFAGPSLSYR